jgi:hypothetical protein
MRSCNSWLGPCGVNVSTVPREQRQDGDIYACMHACNVREESEGHSKENRRDFLLRFRIEKAPRNGLKERTRERCAREQSHISTRFRNILACSLNHDILNNCTHAMSADILCMPPQKALSWLLPHLQKIPIFTPCQNHPVPAVRMHL